jgi:hypothetical protein
MSIRRLSGLTLALCLATGVAQAGELHDVSTTPAKAAVGAPGKARVVLSAKNGWKLNEQAPVSLKVTPPAGIAVDKPRLGRKDLAESGKDKAAFDVGFTAAEAGSKSIDAEASFVICQASACKQVKEKVTMNVDVAAAGAAKPKKK